MSLVVLVCISLALNLLLVILLIKAEKEVKKVSTWKEKSDSLRHQNGLIYAWIFIIVFLVIVGLASTFIS